MAWKVPVESAVRQARLESLKMSKKSDAEHNQGIRRR